VLRRRIRSTWLTRDDFVCGECGAKGDDIGWNDRGSRHPKGEPEDVLFCKKCGHELTSKDELEEQVNFVEKIEAGFFLRFFGKEFKLCEECQEILDKRVLEGFAELGNQHCINLRQVLHRNEPNIDVTLWEFHMYFTRYSQAEYSHEVFTPCQKCQKQLYYMWNNYEMHIGNDTKPMIEFYRRWTDDYKMQKSLENDGYATKSKRDAESWLKIRIELFEKLEKETREAEAKAKKIMPHLYE